MAGGFAHPLTLNSRFSEHVLPTARNHTFRQVLAGPRASLALLVASDLASLRSPRRSDQARAHSAEGPSGCGGRWLRSPPRLPLRPLAPRPDQISGLGPSIGRTVAHHTVETVPCGALPGKTAGGSWPEASRLFFLGGEVGLSVLLWLRVAGWLRSPLSPLTAVRSQAPTPALDHSFRSRSVVGPAVGGGFAHLLT